MFDSTKESVRYGELKLLLKAKEITNLEMQLPFILLDGFIDNQGRRHRPITYLADFSYLDKQGKQHVEDVKSSGTRTKDYLIKRKLLLYKYKNIIFNEV